MKEPLTSREKEIRKFLLEEQQQAIENAVESDGERDSYVSYCYGRFSEASIILGKVLDILGG